MNAYSVLAAYYESLNDDGDFERCARSPRCGFRLRDGLFYAGAFPGGVRRGGRRSLV